MSSPRLPRRHFLASSAFLFASRLATRAAFADGVSDDLLGRIARARAPVRTLKGPFTQIRTIGLLSTDVRSIGTLALVRPERLRWELAPPDDVTFWVGPEGLAYRSAHGHGSMPASSARIAAALQDLHSLLGGDLSRLSERWTLTTLRDDATGVEIEARARTASPVPPVPASSPSPSPPAGSTATGPMANGPAPSGPTPTGPIAARAMRFSLAPDLVRPTRALLVEGVHDRTTIEFGDLVVNAPIDDAAMRPPA